MATIHNFGPFRLDADAEILFRGAEPLPVGKRAVALLRVLVERPGVPVSKDALIEAAWSGLAVEESNLPVQIAALRKVLSEEPGGECWIETLPRRGYRFVGPITTNLENSVVIERQTPAAHDAARPQLRAVSIRPQAEPERRQLSIMSCELVFAGLDLEDMRETVRAYQSCVAEIAGSFRGFVAKHVGNTILVWFGYPAAHENDVERAVRAGLVLCAAVKTLRVDGDVLPHCRVGIATGLVIIGDLIGETQDYSVVGEALDIAVRLQMSAQPNSVVVDRATRRLIGKLFDCYDIGEIEAGATNPIMAWRVLRISTVESRFEALRAVDLTPFVGRDEELDLVLRRWAEVKQGQGRVMLVTGEAGIGKSRLTRAVQEKLSPEPHTPLVYHCSPYHQDSALQPIIGQLSRAASIDAEDTTDAKLEKLARLLSQSGEPMDEEIALFAALLSIPGRDRFPLPRETPRQLKERTLCALLVRLRQLCVRQPVLMLFEDVHWIDPTSLDLVTRIVEQAHDMRLLLLATARPEFAAPWANYKHTVSMTLSRLDRAEGQALIAGITHGKAIPYQVLDQIVAHTDGVPLFIEELTKTVLESGLLREAADRYELTGPLPPLAIPSTLHASLLARLDRLATVKDVAQIGAVIGRRFSYSLIAAVAPLPEVELRASLSQLVSAELIFQRDVPPDATYVFKHALVQDAAYASLIRSRRSQLHAQIANELILRRRAGEDVKAELLGYHCAKADMIAEAVNHYQGAAEEAVARWALSEAAELLDKALAELPRLPHNTQRDWKELELQCEKGTVLLAFKGHASLYVRETYSRARTLWENLGRPSDFLHVPWGLWLFHINRAELQEAHALSEYLLQHGRQHKNTSELILGNLAKAGTLMLRGEPISTRERIKKVIRLYDSKLHHALVRQASFYPDLMASAWLGLILSWLGYPEQALARCKETITLAHSNSHPPTEALCLTMACRTACWLANDLALSKWLSALRELMKDHEFPFWATQAPIYEGYLHLKQGRGSIAIECIQRGLDDYSSYGGRAWRTFFSSLLSLALAYNNQAESALHVLDETLDFAEKTGELWYSAEILRQRGLLLLNGPGADIARAENQFRKAIDISRSQSTKWWELRSATSLAKLLHEQGKPFEARTLLAPVYGWFTEGLEMAELKDAKVLLDKLSI